MTHARSEYKDFMSLTRDAYDAVLALGQVAAKAGMDKQLLELIKLRASQINGCAFCVQFHIMESEKLGVPADKLNLVVVWREAPQFSQRERAALAWTEALTLLGERRQRRGLCAGEPRILREGTGLSHVRGCLDQCLEQVRRRLSLDAAGAEASRRCGGFVSVNQCNRACFAPGSTCPALCPPSLKLRRTGTKAPRSLGVAGCRGIHTLTSLAREDVDGRDKPGHDGKAHYFPSCFFSQSHAN